MITSDSRYGKATVYTDPNGKVLFGPLRKAARYRHHDDNSTVKPESGDNLHKLAHQYLGDASLWWIIADYNEITDPFRSLDLYDEIVIPSIRTVREEILK